MAVLLSVTRPWMMFPASAPRMALIFSGPKAMAATNGRLWIWSHVTEMVRFSNDM